MTTLKDYLRDLAIDAAKIGKEFVNPEFKGGETEAEALEQMIDNYIDIIKDRLIGE